MRVPFKPLSACLLSMPLLAPALGCESSEVERADVAPMPMAPAVPVTEAPEDERPDDIAGSSAGMTQDPTRGLTQ
ncbi:hypothetical protein [Tautonia sociabilis]|uniref:Secreted protein n=1 Tax=Tautonia sociabilis TaxID=2080755 RepID=A0A432MN73_9BACT|nr:hypothetical protein [Tautonia sociabilis]RUL88891.1 hypothetical protein TsocGM_04580 [Tautonia sociabilis]